MNLAGRGLRNLDQGNEEIGDSREREALRLQARKVHIKSLSATVVATVILFLI